MARVKADFGTELKVRRQQHGLTQAQFVEALGSIVARSTIANVEAGRERPSERLWAAIQVRFPELAADLEPVYRTARAEPSARSIGRRKVDGPSAKTQPLGGAFEIERLDLVYLFRESRAPEEILEVRTIRALAAGEDEFRLKMKHTSSAGFESTPEVLWGGVLADEMRSDALGQTVYLRTLKFGRELDIGEQHTFALRSWVERDPEPDTAVTVTLSLAARLVAIHLTFAGPRPRSAWKFGPLPDESLEPRSASAPGATPIPIASNGVTTAVFSAPRIGEDYGIAWSWT